ncbi:unnamed protein product [Cyclocybe aegerita]|uniref:Uncharacterized protein n=1 Tax=Cyclocybe aegerita TaxID=1973307 RepID=A0A8S0VYI4_CYCAE|nr:unnamed protein product [Cyclocybe aegerita]
MGDPLSVEAANFKDKDSEEELVRGSKALSPELNPSTHLAHFVFVDQVMRSLSVPQELAPPERRPPLFIKRSNDILFEASTQHFFYLRTIVDRSAPQVPKVLDVFPSAKGNFMVMEKIDAPTLKNCDISEDESVEVCIVDFEYIGVFPAAFQTYSSFNTGEGFAASVGRRLGYQPSSIANKMVQVSSVLQQCGGNASLEVAHRQGSPWKLVWLSSW